MSLIPRPRNPRSNLTPYVDLANNLYDTYNRFTREQPRSRSRRMPRRMPSVPRPVPFNVRQYTKRMINRQIETKHVHIDHADKAMNYLTWYYFRPLQAIVPGTGQNQRIGDTITNVYMDLGLDFYYSGSVAVDSAVLRVMIIGTDKEISVAPGAWAQTPTVAGNFDSVTANGFHVSFTPNDKNDYNIIYDRSFVVKQTGSNLGTVPHRCIRVRKKLCQRAVYKEELIGGISYNKIKNYYVLVGASGIGTTTASVLGNMQTSGFIFFKDG